MADTAIAYGDSGVGKTTICVHLAKWVYKKFGLTTRLISAEGWAPVENEGLIEAGIVSAYNVAGSKNLLSTMRKLSRGWWPTVCVEEVPILDENGIQTGTQKRRVRKVVEDAEDFRKVGLYFIETTDGIGDAFMRHIIRQETSQGEDERGKLKIKSIGPEGAAGRYEEDGEIFGSNSRGHYNIVQVEIHNLFTQFSSLGGNVKLVFWTSHTGAGKDDLTKVVCYCPLLVGEAKNALVPSWVGECFHLEDVPLVMEGGLIVQQKQVRAYYENHRETEMIEGPQFRAKSRVAPSDVDKLHERFPGGYIPLSTKEGEGIDQYYQWLLDRKGLNSGSTKSWKEQIDANRNLQKK